ncbi:MAG: hypothetical protein AABY95_05915 [Pseudomonadota bacterium]
MNVFRLAAIALLLSLAASAEGIVSPVGSWALLTAKCPMTFELTSEGRLTRTTGTLSYTTKTKLVPNGDGWLLEERLEQHNDGVSCKGDAGDIVVQHLKNKAYIELKDGKLRYSLIKGRGPVHTFVRSDT